MTKTASTKNYDGICHELGFIPNVHFVKITTRGTIDYTFGKPDEVKALYYATIKHGYTPSKHLTDNARIAYGGRLPYLYYEEEE